VLWIVFVYLYINSYMKLSSPSILNKHAVTKITVSQIFSIFLSATTLLPPVKHAISRLKKWWGWKAGEEWRNALGDDDEDGNSNEKTEQTSQSDGSYA